MKLQRHVVDGLLSVRIFALVGLLVTAQLTILAHAGAQTSGTWTNAGTLRTPRQIIQPRCFPMGKCSFPEAKTRRGFSLAPSCITRQQVSGWSLAA